MNTIRMIQYFTRFDTQKQAQECLMSLRALDGFRFGRAHHSPSFGETKEYACQAFFDCPGDINPECMSGHEGMRIVLVTAGFIATVSNCGDSVRQVQ